ncbi:MAG: prepilin-type N-terminal cleavage/methylation domain-containing protein [Candidatus Vecturithrix sp.]|jgi:prepilin-type N-terminal cleavage/methylation domain-containing protein|nr:prepilin-type N-terminal cleavage/methylation domain-containing protein [Candidatus Vecturithrix sp.]
MLQTRQQGVTLVELLVVIAILGILLGGIYGLFDAANRSYLNTRALVESQETARVVMNYLLFRLREIDGSGMVKDPTECTGCHQQNIDGNPNVDSEYIPCPADVSIPRKNLYIDKLEKVALPALSGVSNVYQNLSGYNSVTFWADLLPTTDFSENFTDSPRTGPQAGKRNGRWDLTYDKDGQGYDPEDDYEYLNDMNDNKQFDYYAERWTFGLKPMPGKNFYLLVESLSFTDDNGNDFSDHNKSAYTTYTEQPVAYGLTGLGIKIIPKFYPDEFQKVGGARLKVSSCGNSSDRDTCHGEKASDSWRNVYKNETAFSYEQFVKTHPFWNIAGLSIEVATVDPQGQKFMKMKQMLIPRNIEVNQDVNLK